MVKMIPDAKLYLDRKVYVWSTVSWWKPQFKVFLSGVMQGTSYFWAHPFVMSGSYSHVWKLLSILRNTDSFPNMGLPSKGSYHPHTCDLVLWHLTCFWEGHRTVPGLPCALLWLFPLPCWHTVFPVLCLPEWTGVTSGLFRYEWVSNVRLSVWPPRVDAVARSYLHNQEKNSMELFLL